MPNIGKWPKERVGTYGEDVAVMYLKRKGYRIRARNVARKTGELDVVAERADVLHIVEVKTRLVEELPVPGVRSDYNPADNLHSEKIRRVARTAQWYVAEVGWAGDWQVDGLLVWLRARDGGAHVAHLPQIL